MKASGKTSKNPMAALSNFTYNVFVGIDACQLCNPCTGVQVSFGCWEHETMTHSYTVQSKCMATCENTDRNYSMHMLCT